MTGHVIVEVSKEEMAAMVAYYLNNTLLNHTLEPKHHLFVRSVRQRSNGRFVIDCDGDKENKSNGTDDQLPR
jgi:PBP1b-binding outer membrane lipoprotein LpoB